MKIFLVLDDGETYSELNEECHLLTLTDERAEKEERYGGIKHLDDKDIISRIPITDLLRDDWKEICGWGKKISDI